MLFLECLETFSFSDALNTVTVEPLGLKARLKFCRQYDILAFSTCLLCLGIHDGIAGIEVRHSYILFCTRN